MANQEKIPAAPDTFAVMTRYRDAYKVTDKVVGSGATLKNLGILVMVAAVLGGALIAIAATDRNSPFQQFAELGVAGGAVVGLIGLLWGYSIYTRGQLLMAQGQATLAMLDNAVSTSPFLANEHRAKILSLPTGVSVTYLEEKATTLSAS